MVFNGEIGERHQTDGLDVQPVSSFVSIAVIVVLVEIVIAAVKHHRAAAPAHAAVFIAVIHAHAVSVVILHVQVGHGYRAAHSHLYSRFVIVRVAVVLHVQVGQRGGLASACAVEVGAEFVVAGEFKAGEFDIAAAVDFNAAAGVVVVPPALRTRRGGNGHVAVGLDIDTVGIVRIIRSARGNPAAARRIIDRNRIPIRHPVPAIELDGIAPIAADVIGERHSVSPFMCLCVRQPVTVTVKQYHFAAEVIRVEQHLQRHAVGEVNFSKHTAKIDAGGGITKWQVVVAEVIIAGSHPVERDRTP